MCGFGLFEVPVLISEPVNSLVLGCTPTIITFQRHEKEGHESVLPVFSNS